MASTNFARMTDAGPPVPAMGTLPAAANQLFPKGTIVTRNSSGQAVSPSSADASGFPAMGVSNATVDNRTGSEAGGLAGDVDVEITYGVFGFDFTGTTPQPGDLLFVVDNQTLSIDSSGGDRGVAGYCSEVRDGQVYVWMGPHVMGQIEEIDLAAAEAEIDALEAGAVKKLSLALSHEDLDESAGSQTIEFATALPNNAVVLSHSVTVTEAFNNAGVSATTTLDIGDTDTDGIMDGADLATIGTKSGPLGVRSGGRYSEAQLSVTVNSDVDVDTLTTGEAVVDVFYVVIA